MITLPAFIARRLNSTLKMIVALGTSGPGKVLSSIRLPLWGGSTGRWGPGLGPIMVQLSFCRVDRLLRDDTSFRDMRITPRSCEVVMGGVVVS